MDRYLGILCVSITIHVLVNGAALQNTFRAAVFDKAPITEYHNDTVPTRKEALEMVRPNLELYCQQTVNAKQQVFIA